MSEAGQAPVAGLPPAFLERLARLFSADDREHILHALQQERATSFRLNPLRGANDDTLDELRSNGLCFDPIPGIANAYAVAATQRSALVRCPASITGQIYVQNAASMLPSLVLAPDPDDSVLDLAAAPGSKTLQLAAAMHNRGRIAAVEPVRDRFFRLRANLAKHGAGNVHCYQKDGSIVGRLVPERFDRVLLDAPCSGEGQFQCHRPETLAYWSEKKIKAMQRKQIRLLRSALQSAKVGATIVYSTCTLAPEENEVVVDRLVTRYPSLVEIEPIDLPMVDTRPGFTAWDGQPLHPALRYTRRVLPDRLMEGFFICRLRKVAALPKDELGIRAPR